MATFFVGQRVRKARGIDAGNTGTIVGFVGFWGDKGPFERLKDWDWRQGCDVDVCWDKAGLAPVAIGMRQANASIATPMT
ncbi:hypothetical protein [Lysobacter capsici]|uniref:hypothetical protein n=1 Tax=Lysobacter capsici TaxID=435897 RepID=UPI00398CB710